MKRPRSATERERWCRRAHRPQRADHTTSRTCAAADAQHPERRPASQLDWLSSTTATNVLFWSRATTDLLRSFGWGIAALHRQHAATKLPRPCRLPHRIFSPLSKMVALSRPNGSESPWRVLGAAALLKVEPRVRIRLPPAVSQANFHAAPSTGTSG